jgi:transposase
MNILALDIGKYKTVFCDYVCESGEHEFGRVETTPQAIHDLIVSKQPEKVVMEVCSIAGWIVDIARVLGKETEVANTSHDAWRWKNVKKKTDKEDALKLAKLSAMNQIPTVHMPAKKVREHRSLIKYRQRLVKYKTSIQNSIRAIFSGQGISGVPKGKSAWTKEGLAWFRSYAKPLGRIKDIEQLWRGRLYTELQTFEAISKALKKVENKLDKLGSADSRIIRLQTIPGVGPRLSETVVAFLDNPKRFRNSKHVGSYAGLTPKQYQSGQMERQGGISGQGNKLLRNLFIEICWTSVRHNRWARDTYNRLLRGSPSRKKIAITALARKLLVKCWAMLRDQKDWKYNAREDAA